MTRPDGKINSSPATSSSPILRFQEGCSYQYKIPGQYRQIPGSLLFYAIFSVSPSL